MPSDDPEVVLRLSGWADATRNRDALRGHARLAVDSADGQTRVRSKQIVVLRRPAQLRVEVMGFLNQSIAVVTTDGQHYAVFRAQPRSYRSGVVGPTLLWDEARISLTPGEAIELLLGVPAGDAAWQPAAAWRSADGRIRIDWVDSAGERVQSVVFDRDGNALDVERFETAGQSAWRARYDDFRDVNGVAFAHSIELSTGRGSTRAEIRLSGIELNPELRDDIFRLDRPGAPTGDGEGG